MIFVVLGTQKFQLNRLLKELDRYVKEENITEEIFAQIGNSDYLPQNFSYEKFLNKEEFDSKIRQADLIIAHSGVGTIITSLQAKRPVLVYPRLAKYHEHVDDHQLQIAEAFEKKDYVMCCRENDSLKEKITVCRNHAFSHYESQTRHIIDLINQFIDGMV